MKVSELRRDIGFRAAWVGGGPPPLPAQGDDGEKVSGEPFEGGRCGRHALLHADAEKHGKEREGATRRPRARTRAPRPQHTASDQRKRSVPAWLGVAGDKGIRPFHDFAICGNIFATTSPGYCDL